MAKYYQVLHELKLWLAAQHKVLAGQNAEPGRGGTTFWTMVLDKINEIERGHDQAEPLD